MVTQRSRYASRHSRTSSMMAFGLSGALGEPRHSRAMATRRTLSAPFVAITSVHALPRVAGSMAAT